LSVSSIIFLRDILENTLFERAFSLDLFIHHYFFQASTFLAGVLLISLIGRIEVLKTVRVVVSGYFLLVVPPIIDHFIFLRQRPYEYILPREFIRNFLTLFLTTPEAGPGIIAELAIMIVLASIYVQLRTHEPWRAVLAGFSLYSLIAVASTPRLYFPISQKNPMSLLGSQDRIFFISFYLVLFLVLGLLFLGRINKTLPKALFKELGSFRTLHCILMVLAGTYFNKRLTIMNDPDILHVFISIVLIAILWLSTVLLNHVHDLEIDRISHPQRPLVRGSIRPSLYLGLSSVLALLALFMSAVLRDGPLIITVIILLSSFAYSRPPLRLRNRLGSSLIIGWGSSLAFFLGYFNGTRLEDISFDRNPLLVGIALFVSLSLGSSTKDLKDVQGDLKNGVRTFFTVLGFEKGKRIVTLFLGCSLLVPVLFYHQWFDIVFIALVSALTAYLFYSKEKVVFCYLGYGIVVIYCLLKLTLISSSSSFPFL